jgi:hypothetical protein
MRTDELTRTFDNLFGELMHGVSGKGGFMLNVGDRGLLRSLERLSASEASAATRTGSSIAAHVAHVAYGLSLMNRWSQGENPFTDADWAASWTKTAVTEAEWEALRIQLRDEAAQRRHLPMDLFTPSLRFARDGPVPWRAARRR